MTERGEREREREERGERERGERREERGEREREERESEREREIVRGRAGRGVGRKSNEGVGDEGTRAGNESGGEGRDKGV